MTWICVYSAPLEETDMGRMAPITAEPAGRVAQCGIPPFVKKLVQFCRILPQYNGQIIFWYCVPPCRNRSKSERNQSQIAPFRTHGVKQPRLCRLTFEWWSPFLNVPCRSWTRGPSGDDISYHTIWFSRVILVKRNLKDTNNKVTHKCVTRNVTHFYNFLSHFSPLE